MPIYEYFCPNCQTKFELLRSMSCTKEDAFCPVCNTKGRKVFSTFASLSKNSEGASAASCSTGTCPTCIPRF